MQFNQSLNSQTKSGIKFLSRNEIHAVTVFFVFVLSMFVFIFFSPNYFPHKGPVDFEIKEGMTFTQIVDSLAAKKIIPSKINMKIAAFIYGAEKNVKSGKYSIPNGLSYLDLLDLLTKGTVGEQIKITIQEGIWMQNLAKIFEKELNLNPDQIMKLSTDRSFLNKLGIYDSKSLEGYLLPETYFFYKNSTAENVLVKLKNEMDKLFDSAAVKQMDKLGMNKREILIIASIIDGESNRFDEFRRIAGVYHNRLKKGIKLQADPTIQYLKRDGKRFNRIYFRDLEIDSPFNTYLYPGLPPAPINNPGKEAVLAALYPESHDYLYFVADGTGGHIFSKNYGEHQDNVQNYRQWRSSQDTL